ncbi:MAG: hypothetical protein CM15mP12_3790 [Gammaproteobacteria bacterium]|nr:MAG: hypothetical protein CM15mP12_3790 [Gammaproteobacteria bacterium]
MAVLPVIFFHAGFQYFSGGFIGVDVFCNQWILDYKHNLSELTQDSFSVLSFYERRARRILPALFLVMLSCIPFAWFGLHQMTLKILVRVLLLSLPFHQTFILA